MEPKATERRFEIAWDRLGRFSVFDLRELHEYAHTPRGLPELDTARLEFRITIIERSWESAVVAASRVALSELQDRARIDMCPRLQS